MPKHHPQLLETKILKGWEDALCNDKNIGVIGFDHDGFATFLCGMSGMYKDPSICFLVETFVQTIQIDFRGTQDIRSFGNNNHVWHMVMRAILSARKWNRSVLLSLCLRKLRQFYGTLILFVTLCCPPWPRLDLVSIFRLAGLYTSNTMCVVLYFEAYACIVGRTSSGA